MQTESQSLQNLTLQIRPVNPETRRSMRLECVEKDITMPTLLDRMWQAYTARESADHA